MMPLLAILVEWAGWRTAFVGFGIFVMALAPVAWFLITPASRTALKVGGATEVGLSSRLGLIARNPTFWLLFFGFVLCGFTHEILFSLWWLLVLLIHLLLKDLSSLLDDLRCYLLCHLLLLHRLFFCFDLIFSHEQSFSVDAVSRG